LIAFIATHAPGRALDLGCGTGTNVITLARNGWKVTGVDFARRAIAKARRKVRHAGVQAELRLEDVTSIENVTGKFDLILDIGCFHSLSQDAKYNYARNFERLLSEPGRYLMYAFFKDPGENGPGLLVTDLEILERILTLEERQDGTERGWRPSAWFTFRRKSADN
jgi:cyclopropane fatty-acyl-phospholipid synthase-like methyltransferase